MQLVSIRLNAVITPSKGKMYFFVLRFIYIVTSYLYLIVFSLFPAFQCTPTTFLLNLCDLISPGGIMQEVFGHLQDTGDPYL